MIDTIIEGNEGRCIVHTSSYYYAEQIKFSMKKSFDVSIPKNSRELNDIIDTNITLIGPTLYEGVDFYDERCRINILSKVQFPNLGDKYTKLKMNEVPGWYEQETLNKFIQAYGRGVRHLNDSAVFIILDSNFGKFLNSKYIPGWIKEAFQS
jgi:Rad3-related DNA helicase